MGLRRSGSGPARTAHDHRQTASSRRRAGGGAGEADLALGWFRGRKDAIPQVLCEFKDIRSRLDAKQNRKGSTRSPVEQCLNYVRGARRGLFGNEPVQPWWGLVTDMNEFRLYWWDRAPAEYIRFFIRREDLLSGGYDLLAETEDARFDRYLFAKLFSRDMLLSEAGRPLLLRLVERQWTRGRKLEGEFYDRYKEVRERLYNVLRSNNPDFPGRPGELLRLTQKLLDRFIFAFFCEDMGEQMLFPPQMLRDFLKNRSVEPFYDDNGPELWEFFKRLFALMNSGGKLNVVKLPEINGGLFAPDALIDGLSIPNHFFARTGQGANEASLESDTTSLFYLCARYNYAARGDMKESISLYTLGHIFEQSITELEYREGELEGRETVAKLSKRKRDGVYYTPEKVVNYLVEQTLEPWFDDAKATCGYPRPEEGAPTAAAVAAYVDRLKAIRIADPACGSGAFLISAFRRLLAERVAAAGDVERARGQHPRRDRRTAADRRNPARQHFWGRYQPGVRRNRKACALAAFGAGGGAAVVAGADDPDREQPGRRRFLGRVAADTASRGAGEDVQLAHGLSAGIRFGRGWRLRYRAWQSALREAAEPDEG